MRLLVGAFLLVLVRVVSWIVFQWIHQRTIHENTLNVTSVSTTGTDLFTPEIRLVLGQIYSSSIRQRQSILTR
jgi:hypothetical protein